MQKLSKFTQENVLSLLCWDNQNCSLVRNSVTPKLFDSPYSEIVTLCLDYIDRYKVPIGDHLADEMETLLNGPQGERYQEVLASLYQVKSNFKEFNSKYVIEKLTEFIRSQRFTEALYDAAELHNRNDIDAAQEVMRKAMEFNLSLFDPGIKLNDLHLLHESLNDEDLFPTGIKALDDMKVGPARRQLLVYLGVKSSGKSWFCVQVAKMAVLQGLKVAHITLEISKEIALQRYLQSMFSLSRWQIETVKIPELIQEDGRLIKIRELAEMYDEEGKDKNFIFHPDSLENDNILETLEHKIKMFGFRLNNLYIKEYPAGQLTMPMLRAYLDSLDKTANFHPDLLIVDMPRNMKLSVKDFRLSMDQLYIELRGLAQERNMGIVAPHQINREGAKAKFITGEHVSEDWGILGTADTGLIFNQKGNEKQRQIARLYVDRARSMRSQFTVLMSQAYDIGQYCMDSVMCPESYKPFTDDDKQETKPRPQNKIVVRKEN